MSVDPLSELEAAIVMAAQERDARSQKLRDEQVAKEEQLERVRVVWTAIKKELPSLVKIIDRMLQQHGYGGLAIGNLESKHSDIDRVVLEFAHGVRHHSKILLCVTTSGELTCTVGTTSEEAPRSKIPVEQLTEGRLKEALAKAVEQCLTREHLPRVGPLAGGV